jgi:hypothetical protein
VRIQGSSSHKILMMMTPQNYQTNSALKRRIKKEYKLCINFDLEMVKQNLFEFVNCSVSDPIFKSPIKDKLTTAYFDYSKCKPSETNFAKE